MPYWTTGGSSGGICRTSRQALEEPPDKRLLVGRYAAAGTAPTTPRPQISRSSVLHPPHPTLEALAPALAPAPCLLHHGVLDVPPNVPSLHNRFTSCRLLSTLLGWYQKIGLYASLKTDYQDGLQKSLLVHPYWHLLNHSDNIQELLAAANNKSCPFEGKDERMVLALSPSSLYWEVVELDGNHAYKLCSLAWKHPVCSLGWKENGAACDILED